MIFRMLKVSVNGESQRVVVREVTDLMYNTDIMMDCWVLVFALDNKQSFGEKLRSSRIPPLFLAVLSSCGHILIAKAFTLSLHIIHNLRLHLLYPGLHE